MKHKLLIVGGGLAIGAAVALGAWQFTKRPLAGKHTGVAPWDTPDAPNPDPGASPGSPLVPDPADLVRSKGLEGTTSNNFHVALVAVGRRGMGQMGEALPDSWPVWEPGGGPLDRAASPGYADGYSSSLENHGGRHLTFEISGPVGPDVDVMGYVPETAYEGTAKPELHGWDPANPLKGPTARNKTLYRTCVAVDDRSATHYRFAVADGEWRTIASAEFDPKAKRPATILSGPWGKVVHLADPRRPNAAAWTIEMSQGGYVLEPTSRAPADELRVRFLDAAGHVTTPLLHNSRGTGGRAVRVEVAARPWHWVELSGVHYNPDPAKWPKAKYFGEEGNATISREGGTALVGVVKPRPSNYGQWEPAKVYAPDGGLWVGHPQPQAIRPTFSGGEFPADAWVAAFHLDESLISHETPAKLEAFAADGPTPGVGLHEPLKPWPKWTAERPFAQMLFARPKRPYVQFSVRYGSDEWKKVGEIAVPKIVLGTGFTSPGATTFSVALRSYGEADLYWHERAQSNVMRQGLVKWPKDVEPRVVARLRSGKRLPLEPNSGGGGGSGASAYTTSDFDFSLTPSKDALYEGGVSGSAERRRVLLSDVEAFEIETRTYSAPVYVVAKVPPL